MSFTSTALTQQFMELIWEVVGSQASRAKRARTQYWEDHHGWAGIAGIPPNDKDRLRDKVRSNFPEVHAYFG